MKLKDLNKWFPVMQGLIEVNASTKKKQAYIKVAIPDELCSHIMKASIGQETEIKSLVIAYYDPSVDMNFKDERCK